MAFINYVTQIQFEHGAIALLPQECVRVGMTRPLIVTDAGVKAAGVLQKALDALRGWDVEVFDQTPPNPTEDAVRAAAALYRQKGCDGLIAVGGGSAIDCAKGVALVATHEGPLTRYATIEGGSALITAQVAPLIAVPTTSGTGSEVARGRHPHRRRPPQAGFSFMASGAPRRHLRPGSHTGPAAAPDGRHRHGRHRALHGDLHGQRLQSAGRRHRARRPGPGLVVDRKSDHTRQRPRGASQPHECIHAGCHGVPERPLGAVHSLSHSLGGVNPMLHHGTLNAMFLPAVVEFNAQADSMQRENRLERMARAMGLSSGTDIALALRDMNARLGLPSGLAQMGVRRDNFERIVTGALADHCHGTNPRPATAQDYRELLETSL